MPTRRDPRKSGLNFLISVVKGIEPRDQIEAMLGAQMAIVHKTAMMFAQRIAVAENILEAESAERIVNKCARTFASQIQALKLYRSSGEQTVTVQNVSVRDQAQAIVGNVTQAPRETLTDAAATSPPAITDASVAPMPIIGEQLFRNRLP